MKFSSNQDIGLRIKEKRKYCKLTQAQLANQIGKTESSIRKYEKGLVDIPNSVMKEIADKLNTTESYLYGFDNFRHDVDKTNALINQLKLIGYILDPVAICYSTREEAEQNEGKEPPFYIVSKDNKEIKIPYEVIENLENDNLSYLRYRMEEILGKYSK